MPARMRYMDGFVVCMGNNIVGTYALRDTKENPKTKTRLKEK